jgi:hypothetical protein
MRDTAPVVFTAMVSSLLLVLVIVFVLARSRTLELRLILIGVFMAIAAAVQGNVSAVSIDSGNVAVSLGFSAGSLMKVAAILILSGVTLAVLDRTGPAAAPEPKEVSHGG